MPLLTDLRELKAELDLNPNDTSEDKKLQFFVEQASDWIEEVLNRPGLFFKSRTEYYNGTGTQKLLLRSRPVYTSPTIQVWVDQGANWGATSGAYTASDAALVWGSDFALEIDQDDGTSRSGLLYRLGGYWPRPHTRQRGYLSAFMGDDRGSIKITYSAGYTVNNLPSQFRLACNYLVAKMRQVVPMGFFLTSESYEERAVSYFLPVKRTWLAEVWSMIGTYRNWKW